MNRRLFILVLLLMLPALACNLPEQAVPTSSPVPATDTPLPPTDTPLPPTPTPVTPEPPPPTVEPSPTTPAVLPHMPAGFLAAVWGDQGVNLYDLQGQLITTLQAPSLGGDRPEYVHLAGGLSAGPAALSLVYFNFEIGGALMLSNSSGVSQLVSAPNFYGIAGAPGSTYLAYTSLEYVDAGLRSLLYIGDIATLPTTLPFLDSVNSNGWAIRPLALSMGGAAESAQPVGVWYTTVPYGIGGDIAFEPRGGLYYLNLSTQNLTQVLDDTTNPAGLSPDLTWVAYTAGNGSPLRIAPLTALDGMIEFPLLPGMDRGAGDAVFSPDNMYVAWKEAGGYMMEDPSTFHATIRIATTTGAITAQLPDSELTAIAGGTTIEWIEPLGWLDATTLLIEARVDSWEYASLIRVNFDGSGLAYLVPGSFLGFAYP